MITISVRCFQYKYGRPSSDSFLFVTHVWMQMKFRARVVAVLAMAVLSPLLTLLITANFHQMQQLQQVQNAMLFARGEAAQDDVVLRFEGSDRLDNVGAMIGKIWGRSAAAAAAAAAAAWTSTEELAADVDALETLLTDGAETSATNETAETGSAEDRVRYLERVLADTLKLIAGGEGSSTGVKDGRNAGVDSAAVAAEAAMRRRQAVVERLARLLDDGGNRIQRVRLGKRSPKYLQVHDEEENRSVAALASDFTIIPLVRKTITTRTVNP